METIIMDIKKYFWMVGKRPASRDPNADEEAIPAPIRIDFLHHDNVGLLLSEKYKEKLIKYKVMHRCYSITRDYYQKQKKLSQT